VKLIPVVDIKGGIVVHARGGNRDEYRPIRSRLTDSCSPREVAAAMLRAAGGVTLYLADLDAIRGAEPSWGVYSELLRDGIELWLDAGVRRANDVAPLLRAGVAKVVVGSETLESLDELDAMLGEWGRHRLVFSLDLKAGRSLAREAWGDPKTVAEGATGRGIDRLIVLDLARVGMNGGTGTEELCRELLAKYPSLELYAGGGIRDGEDLKRLERAGLRGSLVATALHQGTAFLDCDERNPE
jgi:phosphoribosylformimino-5-aminoimidazole carboxamide ribotide isomerase